MLEAVKKHTTCEIYFPERYIIWKVSPAFKNLMLEEECGQYCAHHGFRKIFHCALHNAYKLKRWLLDQNNSDSNDTLNVPLLVVLPWVISWATTTTTTSTKAWKSAVAKITLSSVNDNSILIHNIETKTDNIIETINLSSVERSIKKEEKEERFVKLKSSNENATAREVKIEVIQILPGSTRSSLCQKNEFSRDSTCITFYRCHACRSLFRRQSSKDIDEINNYRRKYRRS